MTESSTERQGKMKIGAFQFAGSGDMEYNFAKISEGIRQAAGADVRFLAFHECALTGYPPLEVSMEWDAATARMVPPCLRKNFAHVFVSFIVQPPIIK